MSLRILLKAMAGLLVSAIIVGLIVLLCRRWPEHGVLISLASFCIMLFLAYAEAKKFKDTAGASGCIVYTNYYDVFKCLSVFLVPTVVIYFLAAPFGQFNSVFIFCVLYMGIMTIHIAYVSAEFNDFCVLPVILLVKMAISIIWIFAFYQMLNPSGDDRGARRKTRTMAVIAMIIITPVITTLILGEEGKELVQSRLTGRRFAGAGVLRRMF